MYARLARAVGGHVRNYTYRVDRANIDDVARVATDHVRQHAACHAHQADQVGLDDAGPIDGRADIEACPAADVVPGIVYEDVDRLKDVRDKIGEAVHTFGVCNIELDGKRAVARFVGELTKGFGVAIDQYDRTPAFKQRPSDRATHAPSRAGHHGTSARCFSHWTSPVGSNELCLMRWTSRRRSAGS